VLQKLIVRRRSYDYGKQDTGKALKLGYENCGIIRVGALAGFAKSWRSASRGYPWESKYMGALGVMRTLGGQSEIKSS